MTAEAVLGRGLAAAPGKRSPSLEAGRTARSLWPWSRPVASTAASLHTALWPLARIPGVVPGAWLGLVTLGIVVGIMVQAALHESAHLGSVLAVSLSAVVGGTIGAKAWYIAVHRARRYDGWCIQGFIAGAALVGIVALVLFRLPVGMFLDATAPGLFLGVAVGRPGCFLAGCCCGRITTSRWGLWSSDQRVGARRIPTQLLESMMGLVIGAAALVLIVNGKPMAPGGIFVGALAAYTLGRQFILPLRSELRLRSSPGRTLTVALATLVLIADTVFPTFG